MVAGSGMVALMTTAHGMDRVETAEARAVTRVWIDAAEAVIVRLKGTRTRLYHLQRMRRLI